MIERIKRRLRGAPSTPATTRKNPAGVLLTMAAVGGMFACVALPAYAVNPVETNPSASSVGSQSINVEATVASAALARDAFSATTHDEILAQQQAALVAATYSASSAYVYRDPGPREAGDDYPWAGLEGLSPLRYYYGECVDFVAWRLNRDAGYTSAPFRWDWGTMTPGGGNASSWTAAWQSHGWPVSATPVAGAVAVTGYNHVAYVKAVNADGSVQLEEYNYGNYHAYSQRTIDAGSATYLYPPS